MLNSQLSKYTNEQLSKYTNRQLTEYASLDSLLITDRTLADVERWKFLRDKGWSNMTDVERQEWLGEITPSPAASKGMYTHHDMNRVEGAVSNLVERLSEFGYNFSDMVIKTDWSYRDGQPTRADMERYFGNIERLKTCFAVYPTTPFTPNVNQKMDYKLANNIEKILSDINELILNGSQSVYFSGELFLGEV
jgi:hypothetical protein